MLRAAIDIGSNSVRLLVADYEVSDGRPVVRQIIRHLNTTRLHEGLDNDGRLSVESMARSALAIAEFAKEARDAGVSDNEIAAFATSAVRDASNGADFIALVKAQCGVDIKLLSGEDEARYAFYAAARPGECGVIDIGGASTEMICGRDGEVRAAYSAQIGAVRLRKMLGDDADKAQMIEAASAILLPGIESIKPLPATWVGVAGTITTLSAMKQALPQYDSAAIQDSFLSRDDVERWLDRLMPMTLDERRAIPGLSYQRADIITFGAAILLAFMRLADIDGLFISDRDNLYTGIVLRD